MNKLNHLPLIALVTLGVAACGGDEVETVDDDVAVVATDDQPPLEGDSPMVGDDLDDDFDDDLAMNDPVMRDDAMMGDTMGSDTGMADAVVVTVSGFEQGAGEVYVALQDETIFGTGDATYGGSARPGADRAVEVVVSDVTPGDYAVAAFQDTNGNGSLDIGPDGIPTEPWALSNGAGTQGPPSFDDARMTFDGTDDRSDLQLSSM